MPGYLSEDRVVGLPGIGDRDPAFIDSDDGFAFDEVPADLRRVALLEAAQLMGQHEIQGVRDHGKRHGEVNLH